MRRALELDLVAWMNNPSRLPLLVRGARQVGKTYIIERFGQDHFANTLTINFDFNPKFADCFLQMDPQIIIRDLGAITNTPIIPGKTLLFLDEIQECPAAIKALRYFKERLPELHIIGAGSLLEFTLNDVQFRMPVGRIQSMYLKPLSFLEFLTGYNRTQLVEILGNVTLEDPPSIAIHDELLALVKLYMALGGMPAVINTYLESTDLLKCQQLQTTLLTNYRYDFTKYATTSQYKYLQAVFNSAAGLIAQDFKYADVNKEMRSRDIKEALNSLVDAGLLHIVYSSNANGLPLASLVNARKFKILLLDVGLAQCALGLSREIVLAKDILLVNRGALVEQFVGQELLAYQDVILSPQLYYWQRDKKGSQAEVDFIIVLGTDIIPVEVKSGVTGRLKSLQMFMSEKNSMLGICISQKPLSFEKNILNVPFYLIKEIPRLVDLVVKGRSASKNE